MRVFLITLLLLAIVGETLVVAGSRFPAVRNLLFGGHDIALLESKAEKERVAGIALLPISSEKKSILTRHQIFKGATPQMVVLALGDPRQKTDAGGHWQYHFPGDARPTVLIFVGGVLNTAYRTSNYDDTDDAADPAEAQPIADRLPVTPSSAAREP